MLLEDCAALKGLVRLHRGTQSNGERGYHEVFITGDAEWKQKRSIEQPVPGLRNQNTYQRVKPPSSVTLFIHEDNERTGKHGIVASSEQLGFLVG